ncbi:hypothetical protein GCK32_002855 [Trichostrongylus colubriformis]|uniref:G protein-coupled receptor n=2 Tax=Trichostrongylus colubriformis TaxID=6319 RepID=A0AAN8F8Z0_TRICO
MSSYIYDRYRHAPFIALKTRVVTSIFFNGSNEIVSDLCGRLDFEERHGMVKNRLDELHYVLYSMECSLNVLCILAISILFYICATQRNLHINFRVPLTLIGFGYLISDSAYLGLAVSRMCCIGLENPPIVDNFMSVKFFAMNLHMFAWIALIIERTIASIFVGVYEIGFTRTFTPIATCGLVFILAALVQYMKAVLLVGGMDFYMFGLQVVVAALSCVTLALILLTNNSAYRRRHSSRMHLTNRYELDENIRAGKYLLPVVLNEFLVKMAICLLLAYSIFFTSIPIGYDTTHLSHAYDLIFAYQRLFFAISLIIRSAKFKLYMKSSRRIDAIVEEQAEATSKYFDQLKHAW